MKKLKMIETVLGIDMKSEEGQLLCAAVIRLAEHTGFSDREIIKDLRQLSDDLFKPENESK